jgi:hypothetical protein
MVMPDARSQDTVIRGAAPKILGGKSEANKRFIFLTENLKRASPGTQITISYIPLSRSIREIAAGRVDFYYPIICSPTEHLDPKTKIGSESFGTLPFAIYSRRSNPLSGADLHSASYQLSESTIRAAEDTFSNEERLKLANINSKFTNKNDFLSAITSALSRPLTEKEKSTLLLLAYPYKVETSSIHVPYVEIPTIADISPENSIKKLARGRIDAYIFPPTPIEEIIQMLGVDAELSRDLYNRLDICYLVQNSEKGNEVDHFLSNAFKQIKSSGSYEEIFKEFVEKEKAWVKKYSKNREKPH